MQPPLAAPRSTLAEATVTGLIRDASSVIVGRGLQLVDRDLNVLDEVSELEDGTIRRNSYADNHAVASLSVSRELDWGAGLVRPYITLSDGVTSAAFRLGVYWLPTPAHNLERSPSLYSVECVDYLDGLSGQVGESYAVAAGTVVLQAVTDILDLQGYTQYIVDQSSVAEVVPTPGRSWPMTDRPTWRGIVNDLLASIGYAGVWSDWDGRLRVEPYVRPVERADEWVYDTTPGTGMLQTSREVVDDYYNAPNQWTIYRNNLEEGVQPAPGAGLYRYTNSSIGRSSVEARNGRVIPRVEGVDATSQTALEATAQAMIDADMALTRKVTANVDPNPLHWHFDRCYVDDPEIGAPMRVLCTEWTLPLKGRTMQQVWTVLE